MTEIIPESSFLKQMKQSSLDNLLHPKLTESFLSILKPLLKALMSLLMTHSRLPQSSLILDSSSMIFILLKQMTYFIFLMKCMTMMYLLWTLIEPQKLKPLNNQ